MKLQLFLLCCVLHSIYGFNVTDLIMYPPMKTSNLIVGGQNASDGHAPFQCSMQFNGDHFCGCAIISEKWILTAAHCVEWIPAEYIEILVGTNDLTKGGTRYQAEKTIIHENFNHPHLANDIAVLKVERSIEFNDKVKSIEISSDEVTDGTQLQLTGWGTLKAGGLLPNHLQIIKLKSITTEKCKEIYGGYPVHDSHLCTFNKKGEGACHGDSGGPLVLNNKIVGVVNWGLPCAVGYPDAFAKVSYLYSWIKNNID